MELTEFTNYRKFLLDESKDENGFISASEFLSTCLPALNETKLIDSDGCNEAFCIVESDNLRVDGYVINESGERLQVFIVNEEALNPSFVDGEQMISQKAVYEKYFSSALNFIKQAVKKKLDDQVQDSSPARPFISFLGSSEAMDQIDVIEIFLISATVTVETRGETPSPKRLDFEDDNFKVSYTINRSKHEKELIVVKRLIDLNFLYNVVISAGNREPLKVDFTEPPFNCTIACLAAANEDNFESYLCVLPGKLLADLYKKHSSRMLEKNVRSFLQLRGVNAGMQETIRYSPDKFIAFNNGLTITATGKELINEGGIIYIKSLNDFQIVNGGQTTATIYFSSKAGIDISKISVMAKINVAKNATEDELDDLISSISTFSNAQSRVSKVDLRSRSTQLVKLKSLSESVLTPSGKKWFFERAKGEFNTMIRKNPHHKARINREHPKERRFTKEELAKYYTAWGDAPHLVKKGGEKVFRIFIEQIATDEKSRKNRIEINRNFYENLIGRIILFRGLERIYGSGPRAIGQIRSAVVPYSIAVLYKYIDGNNSGYYFDLFSIWKAEGLDEELQEFFRSLMELMNDLIKKYAKSDDYGEYSKKQELWEEISECREIKHFSNSKMFSRVYERCSISRDALKKRQSKSSGSTADFDHLAASVEIFSNTDKFYKQILRQFRDTIKVGERNKLDQIIASIQNSTELSPAHIIFEKELIGRVRSEQPKIFDEKPEQDLIILKTYNLLLKHYNKAIESGGSIRSEFELLAALASRKGARYSSVFNEIGKELETGKIPTMKQLVQGTHYIKLLS